MKKDNSGRSSLLNVSSFLPIRLIGPRDNNHFVINTITPQVAPQLLLRSDGLVFAPRFTSGVIDSSLRHTGTSDQVVRVGSFLIGARDSTTFVVSRDGAVLPFMVIFSNGTVVANGPTSFYPDRDCDLDLECDGTNVYAGDDQLICDPITTCPAGSRQTAAPTPSSDRACLICPTGNYSMSNNSLSCPAWTTCTADQFQTLAGTRTSDRECTACTTCPDNHHETSPCTASSDRKCQGCASCTAGVTYTLQPCSTTNNTICMSCTDCFAAGLATARPCTVAQNAVCVPPTPPCSAQQYQTVPLTPSTDRACMNLTVCPPGSVQTVAATATSDRQCALCNAGFSDDDSDPLTSCARCPSGHYTPVGSFGSCSGFECSAGTVDNDADAATPCVRCGGRFNFMDVAGQAGPCKPVTICPAGQQQQVLSTPTSDRTCSPCDLGTFSDGGVSQTCNPHTVCNATTQCQARAPSTSQDRVCVDPSNAL
jgi:hypothetical protein